MQTQNNLHHLLQETSLDFYKTLTSTLNNGGAVTFQIKDAYEFILHNKYPNEREFLAHLFQTNSLTQDALECFLKHMMFDTQTARHFVRWQREKSYFIPK